MQTDQAVPRPFSGSKWPYGDSVTAELIRTLDWASTSRGPIEDWTATQRIVTDLLLSSAFPMIALWGPDLTQIYNDGYLALMGDKHPAGMGQSTAACWPEVWSFNEPIYQRVRKSETVTFEDQLFPIYRHGFIEDAYFSLCYSPIYDELHDVAGILVSVTETTQRVRAVEARERMDTARKLTDATLALERKQLQQLFTQAPVFIAVLRGPEHVFELVNVSYQSIFGTRPLIGRTLEEAIPEAVHQGFVELLNTVYDSGKSYVARGVRFDLDLTFSAPRAETYLDFTYQPMREIDGTISAILVLGVDMTERHLGERAVVQREKLVAVERLASVIAHELNNPLAAVTNLVYLAQMNASSPEISGYLLSAERELRRVNALAQQTLRFHKQSTRPSVWSCLDLISNALMIYETRLLNSQITVKKRKRAQQPVSCVAGEVSQVLGNLISNAIDAMHGVGGTLYLRSRAGRDWRTGRHGLLITVADTGIGMSATTIAHLCEPFFSTKGTSGTGLGLWVSKGIMDNHKGRMLVRSSESAKRHGTVFTLFLPFESYAVIEA
jgi:signal transduction histidine kinase